MTLYYADAVNGSDAYDGSSEALAKQTLAAGVALLSATGGDTLYVQATGNYTLTSTVTITQDGDTTNGRNIIEGYTTTPGALDGRPTITSATNSVALFSLNGANHITFRHLSLTHTAATRGDGIRSITATSTHVTVEDCIIDGCAIGVDGESFTMNQVAVLSTEIKNCTSHAIAATIDNWSAIGCDIHDNAGTGYRAQFGGTHEVVNCLFDTNSYGVDIASVMSVRMTILNNTFYANTNAGIRNQCTAANLTRQQRIANNIFVSNGTYGVDYTAAAAAADGATVLNRTNAYYNNTSGARNNLSAGRGDVTLTGDPFTNAASGDFSLDNTASQGAACRAAGYPGVFPGSRTTGYLDIGAVQHQDAGGATGGLILPRSLGGGLV